MNTSLRQLRHSCWSVRSPPVCRPSCSIRPSTVSLTTERRTRFATTRATPNDNPASVARPSSPLQNEPFGPFKAAEVTEDDWDTVVLGSDVPVFVDFWAPWCGPCRMIGPTIDEIIDEINDKTEKFKAVKLNTDQCPNIASKYGIRSIPTVMIFKGGKKVDTIIGAVKKPVLKSSIEKYL